MDASGKYHPGLANFISAQARGAESAGANPQRERMTTIIEQHYDGVVRYLTLLSWNAAFGEEIAQEAFLRLYRELLQGKRIENVRGWLFRVAHNLAVDDARLPKAEHSLSDEDVSRRVENQFGGRHPNPESLLLERERMRRLERAIRQLPSIQRQALYLRREGFRFREIAAILKMGETTVLDHIRRAIERLSQEFHDSSNL